MCEEKTEQILSAAVELHPDCDSFVLSECLGARHSDNPKIFNTGRYFLRVAVTPGIGSTDYHYAGRTLDELLFDLHSIVEARKAKQRQEAAYLASINAATPAFETPQSRPAAPQVGGQGAQI